MTRAQVKKTSQGPLSIWHGMTLSTLGRFIQRRPPMHWSRLHQLLCLPPLAAYNSTMSLIERGIYGRKIDAAPLPERPLFILGHWRSGTTLLHNLICRDEQFTFTNLYQTCFPHHFLLTEDFGKPMTAWMMPKTRPMDNVECGWDLPQEDEVALCVMTLTSPYMMLSFQGQPHEYEHDFDLAGLDEKRREKWKDALRLLLRKLAVRDGRTPVLKSPPHTFRVPVLLEMFPDARFLYIYRNPMAVLKSGFHLRRTLFAENATGRINYDGLEDETMECYADCIDTYERDKALIPQGNLHEVRFEELEADPLGEIEACYRSLGLDGLEPLKATLQPEVERLKDYRKNRFEMDPQLQQRIYGRLQKYFELYGYPAPSEVETSEPRVA